MINNEKLKKHGFLVDIDVLFDTRLAVLESIDEKKAHDLLLSGYYVRERDEFPGFDLEEFRKRYKERNIVTLANSKMTTLMMQLREIIGSYCIESTMENIDAKVELILNIYPYKLTEEELNMFVMCLKIRLGNIVPVRVINSTITNIHPQWLDDNVVAYYCYDWSKWFEHHHMEILKKRMDNVQIIAPKILPISRLEAEKQVNQLDTEAKELLLDTSDIEDVDTEEVFGAIEKMCSMSGIGFSFYEVREFCIMLPDEAPTPPGKFEFN